MSDSCGRAGTGSRLLAGGEGWRADSFATLWDSRPRPLPGPRALYLCQPLVTKIVSVSGTMYALCGGPPRKMLPPDCWSWIAQCVMLCVRSCGRGGGGGGSPVSQAAARGPWPTGGCDRDGAHVDALAERVRGGRELPGEGGEVVDLREHPRGLAHLRARGGPRAVFGFGRGGE